MINNNNTAEIDTAPNDVEQLKTRLSDLKQMLTKASFTGLVQVVADKMGIEIEMTDFRQATQSLSSASHLHDDFEEVIYCAIMREIETLEKEVNA
jgi:hypothetical protein